MLSSSEGRKDPMYSLYLYLKKPPDVIMYDNCCQLDEYTRNRESGFFKNTKFFHDVFHGFAHKCPDNFRSSRLSQYKHIDSEICEQFNSFVQSLKKSSGQMSQTTFTFCLQHFIYVWNLKKRERLERQKHIARHVMS